MSPEHALLEVQVEFEAACGAYEKFNSMHEGYAVLKEEVDELWDEIKKRPSKRDNERVRTEAIQVAAMALRLLVDCT